MFSVMIVAAAALQISSLPALPSRSSAAPAPRIAVIPPAPAAADATTSPEHVARARAALTIGDFDLARREFVMAVALDRDAGALPVESSIGLANVLYAQSYNREAAIVMDRLAAEASSRGDVNVEAKALLDAHWLNTDAKQNLAARANASRLRALAKDARLSDAMRQQVANRFR